MQKGLSTMRRVKMSRVALRVTFLLLLGLVVCRAWAQTGHPGGSGSVYAPPLVFRRAEKLKRGINASEWFAQVYDKRGYTPEHFQAWTTAEDIALIKSMGFDHVRLSVNPQPMFNLREPNKIPPEYLGYLDTAVKMILDHGLAVVIDLHPESDLKVRLAKDDEFVEEFADFWRALAQHYSTWDADRVFLEILNEPEFTDRYRWLGVQVKLAAAIREGAPAHTIIAAGARWSDDDELVFQEPLHDSKNPSSPESAERVAALVPDEVDRLQVIRYGREHWAAARIESEMKQAAEWARRRGVPLVCNEFGVYRDYSDPQDLAAWLHDVRTAFEHNGIGWAMWDYSGSFGVVMKKDGKAVADDGVLRALGMK